MKILNRLKAKKGFTLIELIVVMAVIGILVLLAAPRFLGYTKDANVSAMKADAKMLSNIALVYNIEEEKFPLTATEVTPEAELAAVLPKWNHDKATDADGTLTPDVAVTLYEIDYTDIDTNIKSMKGEKTDYAMDVDGNVYHLEGVEDRNGDVHYNESLEVAK